MPQNLSTSPRVETGYSVLEHELKAESAAALVRLGREVEAQLATLAAAEPGAPDRDAQVQAAADAVWRYFVQREACGVTSHQRAITDYDIPGEVLARVGVQR